MERERRCEHPRGDGAIRLIRTEAPCGPHYVAEIQIRCADCGEPFVFKGIPRSTDPLPVSPIRARISPLGDELYVPLAPAGEAGPYGAFPGFEPPERIACSSAPSTTT